ncbi:hypothetical protein [Streptomyces sp. NPDC051286]|uniref:hypothetical protein n=1 Tax=Streptomyces sp. NPDC051286 TaxID=3365647 RepID=UPI0037B1348A
MSRIIELWEAGEAPDRSGLYRADGSARAIEIDGPALSWFDLGPSLDLDSLLAEDPWAVTPIDVHPQCYLELPDGSGSVCGGDGALGSQGFFARLDPDGRLVWVASLFDSNPFEKAELSWPVVRFTNNLGNSIAIDLLSEPFSVTSRDDP